MKKNRKSKGQIRIAKSSYVRNVIKRVISISVWSIVFLFGVYLCFAMTIVRFVPTQSMGLILTKNITYSGGIIPEDAVVLVSKTDEANDSILGHLKNSFVPVSSASKVKVIAGPYGELSWAKPGLVSVDGKLKDTILPEKPEEYLKDQYIVECISGDCTEGESFIVSKNNVIGSLSAGNGK
jgi:hypothetical protein